MAKNILILMAVILVVFSPCLKADFIDLDDDGYILNNPSGHDLTPHSIKQIFSQSINGGYAPLTTLSFTLEKHFFGLNPFVFHLDNLIFYIIDVLLVMFLAIRIGLSMEASFWATLIFAIHPMRVESVAWVTERKDVLYSLFYLLALHQYWSYLKTMSIKYYFTTFLLGFISILAKPMALSLPLILFVFDWFYGRNFTKRVIIEKVPIFLYVIGTAWITYALNRQLLYGFNFLKGVLIWTWSLFFYLCKFIFPFQVSTYYALPYPVSIIYWPYLLSVIFIFSLVIFLVRFHKHKLFIFAFLYFICSIFFLLRVNDSFFCVVADRYMFLPSLGICFLIGSWADQRIKSRRGIIIFYFFLVLMGIKTYLQCQVWHDSISYWDQIIQEEPNFFMAYNNRGFAFFQKGCDGLALNDFSKAIALNPNAAKTYNNRGIIYSLKGDDRRAFNDFSKAISLDAAFSEPYLNRSMLEETQKDYQHSLQDALFAKKLGGFVDDAFVKRLKQEILEKANS